MRRDTLIDFFHDLARARGEFLVHDDGFRTRRYTYVQVARAARAQAVATLARWEPRPSPAGERSGTGRGVAFVESFGTAVAEIVEVRQAAASRVAQRFDVVGPVCESTDVLGTDRAMLCQIQDGRWKSVSEYLTN